MAELLSEDVQAIAAPITVLMEDETLVLAGFPLSLTSDHAKAVIRGWIDLTIPLGTTEVTVTIATGSTVGGREIGHRHTESGDFVVGATAHFDIEVIDVIQNAGGAQYCMSVQLAGATADGTVAGGLIETTLLSG